VNPLTNHVAPDYDLEDPGAAGPDLTRVGGNTKPIAHTPGCPCPLCKAVVTTWFGDRVRDLMIEIDAWLAPRVAFIDYLAKTGRL